MVEIPHHKARELLQLAADGSLAHADRPALDAHLAVCTECRAYADRLADLEASLREALHHKWDNYRPVLNLQAIQKPSPLKLAWNNLFSQTHALGKVTAAVALLIGYFVVINLVGVRVPVVDKETPTLLPTPSGLATISPTSPTPSIQSAQADWTSQDCKTILYTVQENDTLENIAVRHGITAETILEYNKDTDSLAANTVYTGIELVIPQCGSTPSKTASLPSNLLTITPINGTILPDQPE